MKKYLTLWMILAVASPLSAQDNLNPQDISGKINFDMRLKAIEQRLDNLEKKVGDLSAQQSSTAATIAGTSSQSDLINWASKSVGEIYSYSFNNYKQVLSKLRRNFTPGGYENFLRALDDSKNLKMVEEKKLKVSSKVGTGKVLKEWDDNDVHFWLVDVPVTVNYQNATTNINQDLIVEVEIVKVKVESNPEGLGINNITAKEKPSAPPTKP